MVLLVDFRFGLGFIGFFVVCGGDLGCSFGKGVLEEGCSVGIRIELGVELGLF